MTEIHNTVSAPNAEGFELQPIPPHGGRLVSRLAEPEERSVAAERAGSLFSVRLNRRQLSDLELIAVGAFSPLEGFMGEQDYRTVLRDMRLADGLLWPLPVTLAVDQEMAARCRRGAEVTLADEDGCPLAILEVTEKYRYDRREEARLVYGTEDENHPGVAALYAQGEVVLAGTVRVFELPRVNEFGDLKLSPRETRRVFRERAWRRVAAFQTRNPIHRAHEYLQKCALEIVDGLLIHPLVGETKDDDTPPEVRIRCYRALIERYFPADRVLLSLWPAAMRYAGPREAIFHALVRKNYGCTHFIVGRDHAGVGSYYGPYDAQRIFDEFQPGELGIVPLFFEHAFFCRTCGGMASPKTCPHGPNDRVALSGTAVRQMLARGEGLPAEFTRPEVAEILIEASRAGRPADRGHSQVRRGTC